MWGFVNGINLFWGGLQGVPLCAIDLCNLYNKTLYQNTREEIWNRQLEKEGIVDGREGKVTVVYIFINTYMIYYSWAGAFL